LTRKGVVESGIRANVVVPRWVEIEMATALHRGVEQDPCRAMGAPPTSRRLLGLLRAPHRFHSSVEEGTRFRPGPDDVGCNLGNDS